MMSDRLEVLRHEFEKFIKKAVAEIGVTESEARSFAVRYVRERTKVIDPSICNCVKQKRCLRQVEGRESYITDVYCSKCDKPIYP